MNKKILNFFSRVSSKQLGLYLLFAVILDQILNRWLGNIIIDFATTEKEILFAINLVEKISELLEISIIIVIIWLIIRAIVVRRKNSNR